MTAFDPFLFLKRTGSKSRVMFDCVLADRGSVGDDDQNSEEKVINYWWWIDDHCCQDEKDKKIEKIWRKRKYICSKFLQNL